MDLPYQINTKRLILRFLNHDDFNIFSEIAIADSISENLNFIFKIKAVENVRTFFQKIVDSINTSQPILTFLIFNKDLGKYIGSCGLVYSKDNKEAICFYLLLPRYRGFGFAIEAMKKLIEFAFSKFVLLKIITYINPKCSKVWKVAERVGMKYLGHIYLDEISSKAMYFSINKKEFEDQQII
ncbi:MAG: GNAT family N-acetyltransferase, partial [Promethearchaeota archaeon]